MSFLDELGLKAAEQLEQSVGAYVALASYKRLFGASLEIRARAVFGALRCAVDIGDERELRELCAAWSLEKSASLSRDPSWGQRAQTPAALIERLLSNGRRELADEVAQAEVLRKPTAQSHYLRARTREAASGPDLELWSVAIEVAQKEGNAAIVARAVARWLELLLWATSAPRLSRPVRAEIVARASLVDLSTASPAEKLVVLRARLLGASRFARASALSDLEALARSGDAGIRAEAIRACARHADVLDGRLDPIEADRVRAALRQWPDEAERDRAITRLEVSLQLAALARAGDAAPSDLEVPTSSLTASAPELSPHVNRAQAIVQGGSGGGSSSRGTGSLAARLSALGLDAVSALGRGQEIEAAAAMTRATEALSPMAAVPSSLWTGARMALRSKNAGTRRAAATMVEQILTHGASSPPYGFTELAGELERGAFHAIATLALKEAVRLKEPGASLALAETQRAFAYASLARGDRKRALEALRESKALFDASRTKSST